MNQSSLNHRVGTANSTIWLFAVLLVGGALRLVRLSSAPPGLHFDEAVYGLQALTIYGGRYPIYFPAYTGREPLYMYVMAAVFRLVGVNALGIRLTSALIGIATIPLVYLLMRELFSRRVGLLSAGLLAVSYWHLTVSRNGYPNILIPSLECLALYGLWRGYRDDKVWPLLAGGAVTGLVLYTYLAARFFPITVALVFVYALLVEGRRSWSRVGGLALAALAAVAVFAPLGAYFLRHPEYFWERANQVLVFRQAGATEAASILLDNLARTLGGLFLAGDPRPHFNLPGRPILSPPSAILFGVGLVVTLTKWRRAEYMLLPLWLLGMSLPAILTGEQMPQGQRMFGAIPAIYALVALGMDRALTWWESRPRGNLRYAAPVVIAGLLLFEASFTAFTYFGTWSTSQQTFYTFHSDYYALARYARQAMDDGQTVVVQSSEYKHPTVVFREPRTTEALWTAGESVFVVPNRPTEALYLWACASNPLDRPIADAMERLTQPEAEIPDPYGEPMLRVARLRDGAAQAEGEQQPAATFAEQIDVLDWELPAKAPRDEPLGVLVHWRVKHPGEGRVLTLHLLDERGVLWAQSRQMGYFREQWQPGDAVYQLFGVELPPGIPAGTYRARLVFGPEEGDVLPLTIEGRPAGTELDLGHVELERDGATLGAPDAEGIPFGPDLIVLAHDEYDQELSLGGQVQRAVTWQIAGETSQEYRAAIEFVSAGQVAASYEVPLAYEYPTSRWKAAEVVRAVYSVAADDLPAGEYALRLRVVGLEAMLELGRARVTGQRTYELPEMQTPLQVRLGDGIELLGADLPQASVRPGAALTARLYWRAATPQEDYKVFLHLVGAEERIIAQDDAKPAGWQRPTTSWDVGEVIVDEHTLAIPADAPPGDYTLYVGMYHATSFARLQIQGSGTGQAGDDRLLLARVSITP